MLTWTVTVGHGTLYFERPCPPAFLVGTYEHTGVRYAMPWCGVELWEVELGELRGWNTSAEPVLMCDVARTERGP